MKEQTCIKEKIIRYTLKKSPLVYEHKFEEYLIPVSDLERKIHFGK